MRCQPDLLMLLIMLQQCLVRSVKPGTSAVSVCRLGQTARQLKAESQALSQLQMTLAPSRGVTGIVSDLLHHMTSDGKPAHYSKSFDALAEWVDSSLDMYRVTPFL